MDQNRASPIPDRNFAPDLQHIGLPVASKSTNNERIRRGGRKKQRARSFLLGL
jgi:hypothetical protein